MEFPPFDYQVRIYDGRHQIYDVVRHKYVNLTPEEWVRQHVVHYMIEEQKVPISLIAVERAITVNGLDRRFDIVCFDRNGDVYMLIECKNENVALDQQVFDQAFCYNRSLRAEYVVITNGLQTMYGYTDNGVFVTRGGFPEICLSNGRK